jgi:Family of unknown function (DUF5686)/CarboxypepD_reg-like domain
MRKSFSIYLYITFFLISAAAYPQQYFIHGKAVDKQNSQPLSYANIRVMNSAFGTAANKDGEYELELPAGKYKLIASYIGYLSDTLSINLNKNLTKINFYLDKTNINLPAVTVLPGENPAVRIMINAIKRRKERDERLRSYQFTAYTKGVIETPNELNPGESRSRVEIGISPGDTAALKITGILENESEGYFKSPDSYKEVILARKQSANFPSTINILTGERLIQNFYGNDVRFFGRKLPGPLADNALSYYYFHIKKTLAQDNKKVYDIYMEPDNPSDPGFKGDIFINDSTFDMIKVNLELNRAANVGGIFDTISVFQQFSQFADTIYMPIDYKLFLKVNYLGLARIGFDLNTILYNYKINPALSDDIFNKAVITVLPDADKKTSSYWKQIQTIPNTPAEEEAYKRIDSLSSIPQTFWDNFSILSTRLNFSDKFSTSAPLAMYHFNRVEGHTLDFGAFLSDAMDYRLNSSLNFSYGFSDKKLKEELDASYLLGGYRTTKISLDAFNKINVLFGASDDYNQLTSTLLSLLTKYEFMDYYYSKGFNLDVSGEVFPVLTLSGGLLNRTDEDAYRNTEFSFFERNKKFITNPPIYETKVNALTAGFKLDFRDYIENGLFRRRISMGGSYITFSGNVTYSDKSILKSDVNFTSVDFKSEGRINTFNSASLDFRIFGEYTTGSLPYQMLYALPGNINLTASDFTFRTLNVDEILGNKILTVNIEHNFNDELFRMLQIPGVKNWDLQLTGFLNIGYADINKASEEILPAEIKTFTHPFYEAGFSIGQALIPLRLDFAWRLNYRGKNNFRIGINTFIYK